MHRDFATKGSTMNLVGTSGDSFSAMGKITKLLKSEHAPANDEIHVLPTHQTPEYLFNSEGIIRIQGRGLYCDKPEFCEQMISWIEGYLNRPAKTTYVTIAFEFLNSMSASVLVSILGRLSLLILKSGKLVVRWYYEADDDNIVDRGKYISSTCNIPIEFIVTNSVSRLQS